jgi:hypothetical protein
MRKKKTGSLNFLFESYFFVVDFTDTPLSFIALATQTPSTISNKKSTEQRLEFDVQEVVILQVPSGQSPVGIIHSPSIIETLVVLPPHLLVIVNSLNPNYALEISKGNFIL